MTHRHGVTPLQYQLMLQIQGYPGRSWATVAELAERLQAKHHGIIARVSRSEAAGWVRRVASCDDKRRVEVHLTAGTGVPGAVGAPAPGGIEIGP